MMTQDRHMFPGNNTSAGFFSYYQYILPQQEANHIFCLKGGPGVGKSTFMEKIAQCIKTHGYCAEYMHCSSDPDSLDGVVFPALRAALIDGTAPHIIDPQNPGAVDEIINLGAYWDSGAIKRHRDKIIETNAEVGRLFKRAYRYLAAARCVMDEVTVHIGAHTDPAGAYREAERIIAQEMAALPAVDVPGKVRKMFASAITPLGIVHYLDTLCGSRFKIYTIKNNWGAGVTELLRRVADAARAFDQPDRTHAGEMWRHVADQLRTLWPKLAALRTRANTMSWPI